MRLWTWVQAVAGLALASLPAAAAQVGWLRRPA